MKAATVAQLKKELQHRNPDELLQLCLKLARFKKENKELLTYLLFEAEHEEGYVNAVKEEVDQQFNLINTSSYFYIKKSVRKILRTLKKYVRYSGNKETEVVLLLYFCKKMKHMHPPITRNATLMNLYQRQLGYVEKKIDVLHEDLQYDYGQLLDQLKTTEP
ncbi:Hypothetical protein I595_1680 [Croceitalea dokdonensis DOKDO 023]|uniref:Uncharacterized protein n=1 Tax=Croceitalea dokdonensis DOKDO 023 TaxID=1300341 RepID=A0A0P7AFE0_9FLAO|nr:hypothetical protein [Croceitalea dokdonensis]KPM32032.1 Hypothetical protein I595_1680 [Croceitalea dokdonensis DOKDO 023]